MGRFFFGAKGVMSLRIISKVDMESLQFRVIVCSAAYIGYAAGLHLVTK